MAGPRRFRAVIGRHRIATAGYDSIGAFEHSVREQLNGVIKNLERWVAHLQGVSAEILRDSLQPTFDESQVLVPKDSGDLMRSGYLEARTFRGRAVAEIGYGKGGFPPYAAIVHERLDTLHREPEQAKYLQEPLENNFENIRLEILAGLKEASGV